MPSKIQLDENLWFLFICLQSSDYKTIDFNAVGNIASLKAPAARMRYTRLRRAIESGSLIGTHGTPFEGGSEKNAQAQNKRKATDMTIEDVGGDEEQAVDEAGVTVVAEKSRTRPRRSQQKTKMRLDEDVVEEDSEDGSDAEYEDESTVQSRKKRRRTGLGKMEGYSTLLTGSAEAAAPAKMLSALRVVDEAADDTLTSSSS